MEVSQRNQGNLLYIIQPGGPFEALVLYRQGGSSLRRSRLKIILLYFTLQFSVYTKFGVDPLHLTIWASFHADSSEFRSFLFRSDASANDRLNRCLLKSTLPVPLHGYPCHILPGSTFELRCAALHAPSLPLLYHFFSKVKAFCCIIENCYKSISPCGAKLYEVI